MVPHTDFQVLILPYRTFHNFLMVGDSAKADNGSFEIVGEGNVIQHYQVNGREHKITYTCALHMPTLNANLISVSSLDKAGLITVFSNGKGITRKPDGTDILTSHNINGMYLLEPADSPITQPIAMSSLSQLTSLEQWHQQLAHCSPLTIQEMTTNNLVDGLNVSDATLHGKCENCILGRQTRRPFDGTTDMDLCPLSLLPSISGGCLVSNPLVESST